MKLSTVRRAGNGTESHEHVDICNPSAEDIEAAIRLLDGKSYTLIVLNKGDDDVFYVGGGKDGKYLVSASPSLSEPSYQLIDCNAPSGPPFWLEVGDDSKELEPAEVVSLEDALREALHYVRTGRLSPNPNWLPS